VSLTEVPGTACAGCHKTINPFGFALEDYDSLGRFRIEETVLFPSVSQPTKVRIDAASQIELFKNDFTPVEGGVSLSDVISNSPKTQACYVRHYFSFGVGKKEDLSADGCSLERLRSIASSGGTLKDIYRGLASAPEFKLKKISN
jgi:hypothetical protein